MEGEPAHLGRISPLMARNLPITCAIFAAWCKRSTVPLEFEIASESKTATASKGVSLFFSGGVDSFYSLIKHRDEVDHLVLVHGFDIPLTDAKIFALAEERAHDAARIFGKRLVVARTNLHFEQPKIPIGWHLYHGPALAAVAHALAPHHSKVFIASSYSYADLHPWGSHPLLDPLWSSDEVELVHDGCVTRMEKLRLLIQYPDVLSRLRVCWQNQSESNCGLCEKCVRTMLGLRALGVERCAAFPDTLTPQLVRRQKLDHGSALFWHELLDADLPPDLRASVRSAIHSHDKCLPPRSGELKRSLNRWRFALRHAAHALVSPMDRD
jgi:hypothetical protein